jgi:exodeoxyribonuclease I
MSNQPSLYWHDYETFGTNPRTDRIAQFAGVRTDLDLNIIDEPLVIYSKATDDMLPQPEACLVTGITPQKTITDGMLETDFIEAINNEFSKSSTCVVGFNNIRFDDEFTRYCLYRNFLDPYAREWQNDCSRWDIIDMARITRALRPDGINWPVDDEGTPTNRLELITQANGIGHEAAHDALSDVHATIAVAKLIKTKQPRLYDFIFQNRLKHQVSDILQLGQMKPVIHTSGMVHSRYCNTAMVVPLAQHPTNKNGIIVYDLRYNPETLIKLDKDTLVEYLYTSQDKLPEGIERIALKTIHINKCPIVVPLNTLDDTAAERINIDRDKHKQHLDMLINCQGISKKVASLFEENNFEPIKDPDQSLYSGGFFSNEDRQRMNTIRQTSKEELGQLDLYFDDQRLTELLFRYRARNFPETLADIEKQLWNKYRKNKLTKTDNGSSITLDDYMKKIDELLQDSNYSEQQHNMLNDLKSYGEGIKASFS